MSGAELTWPAEPRQWRQVMSAQYGRWALQKRSGDPERRKPWLPVMRSPCEGEVDCLFRRCLLPSELLTSLSLPHTSEKNLGRRERLPLIAGLLLTMYPSEMFHVWWLSQELWPKSGTPSPQSFSYCCTDFYPFLSRMPIKHHSPPEPPALVMHSQDTHSCSTGGHVFKGWTPGLSMRGSRWGRGWVLQNIFNVHCSGGNVVFLTQLENESTDKFLFICPTPEITWNKREISLTGSHKTSF